MKHSLVAVLLILSCGKSVSARAPDSAPPAHESAAVTRTDHRATLLVLGTYHMANDGEGFLNVKSHDVMEPKRQHDIERLVELLARYKPTKIAVEKPSGDADIASHYRAYLDGSYALTRNEVDQVGFRLAKAMHHAVVHPIDWRNNFDLQPVMEFAANNGQRPILMTAIAEASGSLSELQAKMTTASVLELYQYLNDPSQALELHRIYLTLLRIGKDASYTGADVLSRWYERNLKMTANLLRIAGPDDRILVLVGSGHLHLLQQLAAESRAFVIEPAARYLAPG